MSVVIVARIAGNESISGDINALVPAQSGHSGEVLTTNGSVVAWDAASGGATPALDNLAAVAVNTNLLPDTDGNRALGSTAKKWDKLFAYTANDGADVQAVQFVSRQLKNGNGNSGPDIRLDWSGTDVSLNSHKLTNVTDPTSNQDAATKKYVDDNIGGGGATTALDNLASVAINAALTFADGFDGIVSVQDPAINVDGNNLSIKTGNATGGGVSGNITVEPGSSAATPGVLNILGGTATSGPNGGILNVISGGNPTGSGATGDLIVRSANAAACASGNATFKSGSAAGTSGNVFYGSGDSGGDNTGTVTLKSGATQSTSGAVAIGSGSGAPSGFSGSLTLSTGPGGGATGDIEIFSGASSSQTTGHVNIFSSDAGGQGSGWIALHTGNSGTTYATGHIALNTGNTDVATGDISLTSGDSSGTNSGDITLTTGAAAGTRGAIVLDALFASLPTGASDPTAPAGSVYFKTGTNKLRLYDGSSWVDLN